MKLGFSFWLPVKISTQKGVAEQKQSNKTSLQETYPLAPRSQGQELEGKTICERRQQAARASGSNPTLEWPPP